VQVDMNFADYRRTGHMFNGAFGIGGLMSGRRQLVQWILALTGAMVLMCYGQSLYAADPLKGSKLYQSHCINCHGANGSGEMPNTPDFSRGEKLLQSDNVLLESIKAGQGMMPAYRGMFTDDEIRDVIAYVRTLRR
jgi:mono/diheme cytochrome c family protein